MKTIKLFIISFFLFSTSLVFGQIKVLSDGSSVFGNKTTLANGISVKDLSTVSNPTPFQLFRTANGRIISIGRDNHQGLTTAGIRINQEGKVTIGSPSSGIDNHEIRYAPLTLSGYYCSYVLDLYHSGTNDLGGIRLSSENMGNYGTYIQKFLVKMTGDVYANAYYTSSDASLKNNIGSIENPLEKVMQLRGITFDVAVDNAKLTKTTAELYSELKVADPHMTLETFNQIQKERSLKRIGVVAQEVETVIPEVVRTRNDGLKTVAYQELVGLLIEAIKEQQYTIDDLNVKVAALEGTKILRSSSDITAITEVDNILAQCVLSQNTPNPFSDQTEIRYYLAEGINSATISIFDMQGKMLVNYPAQTGQNSVVIEGSKLQAGMYLYSLIADGQVVDTKRMVLTK